MSNTNLEDKMQRLELGAYRTRSGKKALVVHLNPAVGYLDMGSGKMHPIVWDSHGKAPNNSNDLVAKWDEKKTAVVNVFVFLDKQGRALLSFTPPLESDYIGIKAMMVEVKEGDTLKDAAVKLG